MLGWMPAEVLLNQFAENVALRVRLAERLAPQNWDISVRVLAHPQVFVRRVQHFDSCWSLPK